MRDAHLTLHVIDTTPPPSPKAEDVVIEIGSPPSQPQSQQPQSQQPQSQPQSQKQTQAQVTTVAAPAVASNAWTDASEEVNIIGLAPASEYSGDKLAVLDRSVVKLVKYNHDELVRLIRSIPGLGPIQIRIIELRYCGLLVAYKARLVYIDAFYHASRAFISLGSVAVPAMLSIQSPTAPSPSVYLYWMTWTVSLLVTVLHNFTTLFRFDKKFFGIHSVYERLVSEGWQYIQLSGRYAGQFGKCIPTHVNQFLYFMNSIERIKLKQVHDEFNAITESEKDKGDRAHQQQQTTDTTVKELIPSPMNLTLNRAAK
jgi:hypothetical protein